METVACDSHPYPQKFAGTRRLPLSVLGNGKQTVDERNQHDKRLADGRQRALALAVDPNITLTVRVTALSIAGDGGGGTGGEVANR